MPRVSRKKAITHVADTLQERLYKTCIYLRLSKEDRGYENHDSIAMQQYLLEQYIKTQPDMKLIAVFCDNGISGTRFDRPDFIRMIDAIRNQTVDCIVVKDLSRFGRNYVETGYYLETLLPCLGVRFVAVNDSFDTLKGNRTDDMAVSLKNIVNSLFAKDISRKSGSTLRRKQENGEFIGSFAPYGYQKSNENKHHLILDPITAPIVRKIFEWRLEGAGYGEIAKKLNNQSIPCPAMTRFLRNETQAAVSTIWTPASIKNIVGNMGYAGHTAQGKQICSLCDGIPKTAVDKEDWVIVRNTHEPIVSENIWNAVSSMNQTLRNQSVPKRKHFSTENKLVGLVFCMDCGKTMARLKNCSRKGHIRYTFNCRIRKASKGESGCTNKNIGEVLLLESILASIRTQIAANIREESFLNDLDMSRITHEMLVHFIHHITISGRCDVHIFWNYHDPYSP